MLVTSAVMLAAISGLAAAIEVLTVTPDDDCSWRRPVEAPVTVTVMTPSGMVTLSFWDIRVANASFTFSMRVL